MLALIAFSIQAAFASTIHTSYSNDPNIVVPSSTALHWYDMHKPHTHYLIYKGPNTRPDSPEAVEFDLHGPLVGGYPPGFHPKEIRNAYNVTLNGSNAIAVIDYGHLTTALSDFNTFSAQFGLPQETSTNPLSPSNRVFQVVYNPPGVTPPVDAGWNGEEALDMEWAHAMAPNAKIYVIESSDGNLDGANLVAAALPGCKEVSNSWGYPGEAGSGELALDSNYQHAGTVFLASAGDIGGLQSYPSESPYVVSVGGTSLVMDPSGTIVKQETGWVDGGGGPSNYEPRPIWQNSVSGKVGSQRGDPDLAAVADPYTGVAVYSASQGGWVVFGGTSVSCPLVSGIVNSSNTFFANSAAEENLIYSLLNTKSFRDITQGSAGSFSAGVGWDFVTGCGAPLDLTIATVTYVGQPDQVTTLTGNYVSGNVASLATVDSNYYDVTGVPFTGLGSTADARAHFTFPNAVPSKAAGAVITVVANASVPQVVNEIFLYNYITRNYELFGTPLLSSGNTTFTITLTPAQAPKFVDPAGNVTVLSRALLPQADFNHINVNYTYNIDKIGVAYTFYQR